MTLLHYWCSQCKLQTLHTMHVSWRRCLKCGHIEEAALPSD